MRNLILIFFGLIFSFCSHERQSPPQTSSYKDSYIKNNSADIKILVVEKEENESLKTLHFIDQKKVFLKTKATLKSHSEGSSSKKIYALEGPFNEGDSCNFSGTLELTANKANINSEDVGSAFYKNCEAAKAFGDYSKAK